jgi:hypothetical protein
MHISGALHPAHLITASTGESCVRPVILLLIGHPEHLADIRISSLSYLPLNKFMHVD